MSFLSKILNLVRGAPVEVIHPTVGVYRRGKGTERTIEQVTIPVAEPTPITRDEYRDLNIEMAYRNHPLKVDPPREDMGSYAQVTGLAPTYATSGLLSSLGANPSGSSHYVSGWTVLPSGDPGIFCAMSGTWVSMTPTCLAVTGSVSYGVSYTNPVRHDLFNALSPREQRELLDFFRAAKNR